MKIGIMCIAMLVAIAVAQTIKSPKPFDVPPKEWDGPDTVRSQMARESHGDAVCGMAPYCDEKIHHRGCEFSERPHCDSAMNLSWRDGNDAAVLDCVEELTTWLAVNQPEKETIRFLVRWLTARMNDLDEAAEKLANTVEEYYPTIARHVIQLQEAREENAAAKWNEIATAFQAALTKFRTGKG